MLKQAVILAGGRGTRLGERTNTIPKPLLPVGGRPFLEYLVWNLCRHGLEDIVLSVGYCADRIIGHFGDGSAFGAQIRYCVEQTPMGTGGAVREAADILDDEFIILNGDTIFCYNYLDLAIYRRQTDALVAMALREVQDASRYGQVAVHDGIVTDFKEKSAFGKAAISAGVYACSRDILDWLPHGVSSLETDVFPSLVTIKKLAAKLYNGFFLDIGLPETYELAQTALPAWQRKPAVILDRDGVLNVDYGYVSQPGRFQWIPGAREAVKWLNDQGYLVLLVTNQAGIARGYYTEEDFFALSAWMQEELRQNGAHIDAVYFCPHHPESGKGKYLQACTCRKPKGGMLFNAMKEWKIDLSCSLLIGDKPSDISAAECANIPGFLFKETNLLSFVKNHVPSLR